MNSEKTVVVKFVDNNSARWDGKVTEVPGETVVRTGRRGGGGGWGWGAWSGAGRGALAREGQGKD